MPLYAFVHPVWQLVALYFGIKNLAQGFKMRESWAFSYAKHRKIGLVFVIMTLISAFIGQQANLMLISRETPIRISGHQFIAWMIIALIILIVISGFVKHKRLYRFRWLSFLHSWFGALTIGLMFTELFLTLAKIVGW